MTTDTNKRVAQLAQMQDFATVLVRSATDLKQRIDNSKTLTKRTYYGKKFKKVSNDLTRVLSTIELLKTIEGTERATTPPTSPE
jgi:flagellar hook assembly protein FlgD